MAQCRIITCCFVIILENKLWLDTDGLLIDYVIKNVMVQPVVGVFDLLNQQEKVG